MKSITIGKYRGLQQISSRRGTFTALALDHRQNLRKANPEFVSDEKLSQFKIDVVSNLASHATAVLLDPEVSAAQAIASSAMPGDKGLVVALESTGYTGDPTARRAQIIPGWSVEKAKRMGASAIKLLVYYHPESSLARETEDFVATVAEECKQYDLTLMLEPLSYALEQDTRLTSEEKHAVVIETARRLSPLNIDILKVEFPLDIHDLDQARWQSVCQEVTSASVVPWILLSAAADYDLFLQQVIAACTAGASGVAVGRAVWQEAVMMEGDKRNAFLRGEAKDRLVRLTKLCTALGKSFGNFYHADAPFDWYRNY